MGRRSPSRCGAPGPSVKRNREARRPVATAAATVNANFGIEPIDAGAHSTPTPHGANSSHTYRRDPANPSSHGPPLSNLDLASQDPVEVIRELKWPRTLCASLPTAHS